MTGSEEIKYGTGNSWQAHEYAPLDLNEDALKHVATYYLPGNHGKGIRIHKLERGSYHEIRMLEFEDGWTCIGRFARRPDEHLAITESEYATMKYVHQHTSVPVPETYLFNFDPTDPVGASFVLMEHMPGRNLDKVWD